MSFTQWSSRGDTLPPTKMPNFTFVGAEMWEYSLQNCQNLEFCPHICPSGATRLHNFYKIISVCTRLQVAFNFLIGSLSEDKQPGYKHFPSVEAFSAQIFNIFSGKTTHRIKTKLEGCKKMARTFSITVEPQ